MTFALASTMVRILANPIPLDYISSSSFTIKKNPHRSLTLIKILQCNESAYNLNHIPMDSNRQSSLPVHDFKMGLVWPRTGLFSLAHRAIHNSSVTVLDTCFAS